MFPRANKENFDSQTFMRTLLSKKKVAVVPRKAFSMYPKYIRLTLSTNKGDMKEGVKRIGGLLEEWL